MVTGRAAAGSAPTSRPIDADRAADRGLEAGDQVEDRGLARARRPDERRQLARRHGEVEAMSMSS
jgi:hypothetical protein